MAISQYYVDPVGGNNSTGDGTSGTPWKSVQWALDHITRNATNGDQINVKAGGTDTLGAALSLATYGTPSDLVPLVIRGYTSTANDGGIGVIDGAATYSIYATASKPIHFVDMKLGNCGSAPIIDSGGATSLWNAYRCELHTSTASTALRLGSGNLALVGCYIHDCTGATTLSIAAGVFVFSNYITKTAGAAVILTAGNSSYILNNVIALSSDTSMYGIDAATGSNSNLRIVGNTIYSSSANTNSAIKINNAVSNLVMNNIMTGFSGSGGKGLIANYYDGAQGTLISGGNAYYNNATPTAVTVSVEIALLADVTLGALPFTNAAGGDFSVSTALKALGFPSLIGPTTNSYVDIGAAQRQEPAGGGGPIFGGMVVR